MSAEDIENVRLLMEFVMCVSAFWAGYQFGKVNASANTTTTKISDFTLGFEGPVRSQVAPLTFTPIDGEFKVGDCVSVSTPWWERRKWGQLWKPKWIEHPAEKKAHHVASADTHPEGQDRGLGS